MSQPPPPGITDLAFSLNSQTQVAGEARTGEAFSYNLRLSNIGANAAQNVRVAQILPDSVRFLSSSQTSSISGDSLIWQIAAIAAGAQDSIIVNVQLAANVPATLTELISFANFTADNDTTFANNSDSDTLRVISQPPPPIVPPQITATPPMVQVGDSVFIRVQVEQAIQKWDLWVYFVTGAIDSSFADGFIAGTPLTPQIWYDVHPAFSETKLLTQAQQERIEFELRTIDRFGRPASTRANVTVRAGNALVLDRNVYEAERQGPLAIKFRLSSNRVARLDLLDLNGQKVTEIIQAPFSAGWNTHFWNGFTQDGRRVGSGVYVVTLHSQDFNDWKKVIVVR
ncbi:hypothetical protein DCC62_26815 [candidate division KSB1 bacterium]|nr:MAG: hypothetical protein DCC62_26815 [candidate division KSB1 bacterium]